MLTVFGSIVGIIFVIVGGVWLYFNLRLRPLHEAEVELMRRSGRMVGETDWVEDFNVADSEWDLETNRRNRPIAATILWVGVLLLGSLIVRAWLI